MIEIQPESQGNILAIKASGKLTDHDYKDILFPHLEALIKEHDKVRLLFFMAEDFHGWQMEAAWDDISILGKYKDKLDKLAIVGGPKWVEWSVKLGKHFLKEQLKTFSEEQLQDAWDWVKS